MRLILTAATWSLATVLGCGGDARMEITAADALEKNADQIETAIEEYHDDADGAYEVRETQVITALVRRVQADAANDAACEEHSQQAAAALAKVRTDRETARERKEVTLDNVDSLREVARFLRRVGIDSLSLSDEARRYLDGWVARKEAYDQAKGAQQAERKAARDAKRQGWIAQAQALLTGQPRTPATPPPASKEKVGK